MPHARFPIILPTFILGIVCLVAVACGGGDGNNTSTDGPTPTPFSLGSTLSIRGQQVKLADGIAYFNQTIDCQDAVDAGSPKCVNDLKMLERGQSYILFDPTQPKVIARRIEPEDEADFRPLLGLISGTTSASGAPVQTPSPSP